jgi:2',3'-cyclic-nucleotide 2'-phosphodiesterase (5'-nucleotidase family)
VFDEAHGARGCRVVKAGEDAKRVVIVDLFWPAEAPRGSAPEVTVQFKPLAAESEASGGGGGGGGGAPYVPDPKLAAIVERWSAPAIELQTATLADLSKHPSHPLSSRDVRSGPNSMATVLATALKVATRAEVALLNSGGVRAKKIYEDGKITYADLSAECPFPAPFVVMKISGKALSDALVASRTRWHVEGGPEEDGDSFQVDDGIAFDATTDEIQTVMYGKPLELERLYELVVDSYMIGVNPVLKAWREANPALIPPDDAGRPALPILVQYFCDKAWTALVDENQDGKIETAELDAFFDAADADGSGKLDEEEVLAALREKLGHMASSVVARQMLAAADRDQDGKVSKTELVHLMKLRAGREE